MRVEHIPLLVVVIIWLFLAIEIVDASDSREDNLLRSTEKLPCRIEKKKQVDLYVTSKSQLGADALLTVAPLAKTNRNIRVTITYIVTMSSNGTFQSVNGASEVEGDVWGLCAIELYQDNLQYLDFLTCVSQGYANIPYNLEGCANRTGLDLEIMHYCVNSRQGELLLNRSCLQTSGEGLSSNNEVVIFIDHKRYDGLSRPTAFAQALCGGMDDVASSSVYHSWWFYLLVIVGALGVSALLAVGVFTAYRLYVKCNRASDMWLDMIKSNNALNFADKVQDTMHRYEKDTQTLRSSSEGINSSTATTTRRMEEGRSGAAAADQVGLNNSISDVSSNDDDYEDDDVDDVVDEDDDEDSSEHEEESPLLSSALGVSWSMGGIRY